MRAVIQRVSRASVTVEGRVAGEIGRGFAVLLGVAAGDGDAEANWMADKIAGLRLFEDEAGKMNASLEDVGGAVLVISQFTLYGDARKGRRPSFSAAARPEPAELLVDRVVARLRSAGLQVATGEFGAHMDVEIHNDGPVTILLEREAAGLQVL
jgi:D-tyrosyl-tRNA(Tyr) deacylase